MVVKPWFHVDKRLPSGEKKEKKMNFFGIFFLSSVSTRLMTATPAEIQRLIECSMCCDYLNDVRETPCCHQLVCLQCIRSWLEKPTKNCPKCRSTTLVETNLLKNPVIQRFVDQLQFSCPNQLKGCQVKMIKADLNKHLRLCDFSPMKLAEKQRLKLQERRSLLLKFKEGKTEISDNVLYDLAKTFLTEREFQTGKECLEMIKDKKKLHIQDVVILQAQIERDSGQFDKALELYTKAYAQARSVPQRIDLLAIIGELYLKKAQYERADDILRQALDLLPSDDTSEKKVELLNNLGLVAKKCSDVSLINEKTTRTSFFVFVSVRSGDRILHGSVENCRFRIKTLGRYHSESRRFVCFSSRVKKFRQICFC